MHHPGFVHYIPIVTTIVAALFAPSVYARWKSRRPAPHLIWWAAGIALYGVGTFAESWTTLFGWNEWIFRSWYISGALLGGAPLAQGTVYLLASKRVADRLSVALISIVTIASVGVLLTPIHHDLVESHRLTGSVMAWQGVRLFSPFVNTYAFIFLAGGAAWSAWKFRGVIEARNRVIGNLYIAVGAILPGIGGTATRMGYTEVLYVTELIGLTLIWIGYRYNISSRIRGAPMTEHPGVTSDARGSRQPSPAS
ncbi:MAG: hypothetical protein RQ745_08060 [Longimicrobiales bacterium]|nr:hypothetical protein [Longimicrobiales bacterium]